MGVLGRQSTLGVLRQVGLGLWPVGARERDRENSKIPEAPLLLRKLGKGEGEVGQSRQGWK